MDDFGFAVRCKQPVKNGSGFMALTDEQGGMEYSDFPTPFVFSFVLGWLSLSLLIFSDSLTRH